MKFLCNLLGCESKTVVKEVPLEVIKEIPVEVVKEIPVSVQDSYPNKPDAPILYGSLEEQLFQIYDHYGMARPAEGFIDLLGDSLTPEYIELVLELIEVINDKTIEYMNRPAYEEEIGPALATTSVDMIRRRIKGRKDRSRSNYVVEAVRNDLPICGCSRATDD
jgi:hypothetical protein